MRGFLNALKIDGINDVAAIGADAIGNAFDGSNPTLGVASDTNSLYILSHAALGFASSAALGTGCEGGAIGGATSAFLNPLIDSSGNIPTAVETAIATLAGGVAAGLAGGDAQAGANAAENETLNNWLNHVQLLQYANAKANCPGSGCEQQYQLAQTSQQNNQNLSQACSGLETTPACAVQMALAMDGGNTIHFESQGDGRYYVYANALPLPSSNGPDYLPGPDSRFTPTGTITSLEPSPASTTLDNMLGSPFGGIFGGYAYVTSGSTTNAYYASASGNALTGIFTLGVASTTTNSSPEVESETVLEPAGPNVITQPTGTAKVVQSGTETTGIDIGTGSNNWEDTSTTTSATAPAKGSTSTTAAATNSELVPFSLPNGATIEGVAADPSLAPAAPTQRYQITPAQAAQYLQQMGLPQSQIDSFVNSFQGPIYVRNALPGETFGAYSGGPENPASGQFLTPGTAGQTPGQVTNTLALPPSNPATTLNAATINQPIPVLEGVVAPQNWNGVQSGGGWQVFVPGGARYGANPPVTIGPKLN